MTAVPTSFAVRSRLMVITVGALLAMNAACAGDNAALPEGPPAEVVGAAPDATVAAGTASVIASAPTATAEVEVDFEAGRVEVEYQPANLRNPRIELRDPAAVLDLVRGAINVEPYGGAEVRGVSTMRYEVDLDAARAARRTPQERRAPVAMIAEKAGAPFFADVYVDNDNRVRRVTIPVDYAETRPRGRERRVVSVITVDFVDFPRD